MATGASEGWDEGVALGAASESVKPASYIGKCSSGSVCEVSFIDALRLRRKTRRCLPLGPRQAA